MRYLVLFFVLGAALVAVADSLQLRNEITESKRISRCNDIKLYRRVLPVMEKFWKYLAQKYRCDEKTPIKGSGLTCGIRRTEKTSISLKIEGGKEAIENSWPWQVSIFKTKDELTEDCVGTLIAGDWVLTSATCIAAGVKNRTNTIIVRVGDHNVVREDTHEQSIGVSKVILHSHYKNGRFEYLNDIALLRLKSKVSLSDRVNAACLPGQRLNFTPGTRCTVLGWGMKGRGKIVTSLSQLNLKLQELQMPLISYEQCKEKLFISNIKPSKHICVSEEEGKGIRAGDIGVPLLCPQNEGGRKRWYLAGLFSFKAGMGSPKYEVFTRVSGFTDWIERMQRMYAS